MKKRLQGFVCGVVLTVLLGSTFLTYADSAVHSIEVFFNTINLKVNGKTVTSENLLYNGRTYVPLRSVSEMLGKDVLWDNATKTASINDKYYTVGIGFTYDDSILPESWLEPPINGYGESLPPEDIDRAKSILNKTLKKYPQDVLTNFIYNVYILKYLSFYDVEYGATASGNCIYIKMGSDTYVEESFHHEFSHLLYYNKSNLFDQKGFTLQNPEGFEYLGSGVEALKSGQDSVVIDTELCSKGFLNEYAQSDIKEDIASFAVNLFSNDPDFWEIVDTYPVINKKLQYVIDFYHKIDGKFTEEYFRNLPR